MLLLVFRTTCGSNAPVQVQFLQKKKNVDVDIIGPLNFLMYTYLLPYLHFAGL